MASTAQELTTSSDKLTRFWIALCAACLVFGANNAVMWVNQDSFQNDLGSLSATVEQLAIQASATAIQTQTYQQGALRQEDQQNRDIQRITDLLNELIQRQ